MACAINPLGDLYKTQVWDLAREVGLPEEIIEKVPTADLWHGQTDEGELGFHYSEVDRLLNLLIDNKLSRGELIGKGFREDFIDKVEMRIQSSEYKRRMPIIVEISRHKKGDSIPGRDNKLHWSDIINWPAHSNVQSVILEKRVIKRVIQATKECGIYP